MAALLDLLVMDRDNPRSLGWVAHTLRGRLAGIGRNGRLAFGKDQAEAPAVGRTIVITRTQEPNMENHRIYQKAMELYLQLYENLKDTFSNY